MNEASDSQLRASFGKAFHNFTPLELGLSFKNSVHGCMENNNSFCRIAQSVIATG